MTDTFCKPDADGTAPGPVPCEHRVLTFRWERPQEKGRRLPNQVHCLACGVAMIADGSRRVPLS